MLPNGLKEILDFSAWQTAFQTPSNKFPLLTPDVYSEYLQPDSALPLQQTAQFCADFRWPS